MRLKKWAKLGLITLLALLLVCAAVFWYGYFYMTQKFVPNNAEKFTKRVAYIDPETALLNDGFKVCNEFWILDYYNPERARYSEGKNGLRTFILGTYENRNYTDSGYLNIRFVINCKGEPGRYTIHENDLDLEPHQFSANLKQQLFELTTKLKKWKPNFTQGENRDSYMYISYKIEHGEITEILP
jgi:hypothetical protein